MVQRSQKDTKNLIKTYVTALEYINSSTKVFVYDAQVQYGCLSAQQSTTLYGGLLDLHIYVSGEVGVCTC